MNKKGKNHSVKLVTAAILKTYVTQAEFKRTIRSLSRRDDALSRAIVGLDKKMDEKFKIIGERFDQIDNKFNQIANTMDSFIERFNRIDNNMDAFIKRTEQNEREIIFLGHQHDDLAGYCTNKIGYPIYGRNL